MMWNKIVLFLHKSPSLSPWLTTGRDQGSPFRPAAPIRGVEKFDIQTSCDKINISRKGFFMTSFWGAVHTCHGVSRPFLLWMVYPAFKNHSPDTGVLNPVDESFSETQACYWFSSRTSLQSSSPSLQSLRCLRLPVINTVNRFWPYSHLLPK